MKEKENEIEMSKKSFVKEHKKLVKVLKKDNPKEIKKEMRSQRKEMLLKMKQYVTIKGIGLLSGYNNGLLERNRPQGKNSPYNV